MSSSDSCQCDDKPHSLIIFHDSSDGGVDAYYVPVNILTDDDCEVLFGLANPGPLYFDSRKHSFAKVNVLLGRDADVYVARHPDLKPLVGKWQPSVGGINREELTDHDGPKQCYFLTQGVYLIDDDYFKEEEPDNNYVFSSETGKAFPCECCANNCCEVGREKGGDGCLMDGKDGKCECCVENCCEACAEAEGKPVKKRKHK